MPQGTEFLVRKGLIVSGSITGQNQVIHSITASNAATASYVLNAISSSFSVTSSHALNIIDSPFRLTGSHWSTNDSIHITGSLNVTSSISIQGDGSTNLISALRSGQPRLAVKNGNEETLAVSGGLLVNQAGSFNLAEFRDSGVTRFIIKDGGDVGIGTASPSHKLSIKGAGAGSETILSILADDDGRVFSFSKDSNDNAFLEFNDGSQNIDAKINTAGDSWFNGGNVGIGTSSPNEGLTLEGGVMSIRETTTPTATTNYGKVYTKSDNKLYFQDGAGTEHEIAFV